MSQPDYGILMKNALNEINSLRSQLAAVEAQKNEPIAIVGMGCRFPGGATTPERFWVLLREGRSAITEIPADRWNVDAYYDADPTSIGKMHTRHGGFLDRIDTFEASFFNIAGREAVSIDPQQRLLLEVSWEALESANIVPATLFDSSTGVFIGLGGSNYKSLMIQNRGLIGGSDLYDISGTDVSVAAGRISYILGLTGPSFVVDTACSSSLVSVHQACQSLRQQECDLALAGGVGLLIDPDEMIGLSQGGMLAPDGSCKTFDAAANGYVRGEGCGIIAVKRLSDATANGDNILAVIRGSMINHDGHSSGLTAPRGPAQVSVIKQALHRAGIEPDAVSYIEAHGTGTPLGDPIEIDSLAEVFGQRTEPLWVGSVKTNIGHLEAGAGIAGIIKVVLMLQNQQIPPHLHFKTPNPYIDWENIPVKIPTTLQGWYDKTSNHKQRIAGVSSFGFSGTNAHIVLAEAPPTKVISDRTSEERPRHLLTLSAKNEEALAHLVQRYQGFLSTTDATLADICYTANTRRTHFEHRLALSATSCREMQAHLTAYSQGLVSLGITQGYVPSYQSAPKIAFLFTGQGSQYVQMGQELYQTQPTFRQTIDRCDEILREYLDQPLLSILYPQQKSNIENRQSQIHETVYTQPTIFALEYAIAQLWQSWGIKPDIVIGHSVGEYVAACVAGVFSLEDGLKLIATRGRLMQALPHTSRGEMVAILGSFDEVMTVIQPYRQISIAAINGPRSVVISGDRQAVQSVITTLEHLGMKCKRLSVSHAFHSSLMEPMQQEFAQVAKEINYSPPKIALVSNLTGDLISDESSLEEGGIASPTYWVRHIREPVRFADGIATLQQQDVNVFLELGPKPTLSGVIEQYFDEMADCDRPIIIPSLQPQQSNWETLLQGLGRLYMLGVPVDWVGFDGDYARHQVRLPTYAWNRQSYWVEIEKQLHERTYLSLLVDKLIQSPRLKEIVCETDLSVERLPFLIDHQVFGEIVSPGACHIATVLEAAYLAYSDRAVIETLQLVDIVLPQALVLGKDESRTIQVIFSPPTPSDQQQQAIKFELISFQGESPEETAQTHASGYLEFTTTPFPTVDIPSLQTRCRTVVDLNALNAFYVAQEIHFGPAFCWLAEVWCGEGEVMGRLSLPDAFTQSHHLQKSTLVNQLHPALLDACLQLTCALQISKENTDENPETSLPFSLDAVTLLGEITGNEWWCHAQQIDETRWHIQLLDNTGAVLVQVERYTERVAPRHLVLGTEAWKEWLYEVQWQPKTCFGHLPTYLPNLTTLSHAALTEGTEYLRATHTQQQAVALHQLNDLCIDYILAAFSETGFQFEVGSQWHSEQLARQLGVIPSYRRLLDRLLQMLSQAGVLSQVGETWQVLQKPTVRSPQAHVQSLQEKYGTVIEAELELLTRCAQSLSQVLCGTQNPLELLFPNGDASLVNRIYRNSPIALAMNQLVQNAVKNALEELPAGQGVRILEIGAGTGGTTEGLLPLLPTDQTDYLFTDIGEGFLRTAQEKFADYPFLRYQTLDIEQSPAEQGIDLHQYDIVIAANVLHATRHLPVTLNHVQQLLAPGGLLLLLEDIMASGWVDLTFGLTDSWWGFADQRQKHPLLSATQWQQLLLKSGFHEAVYTPEDKSLGQAVILAQASATVAATKRVWLLLADRTGTGEVLARQLCQRGEQPILVYAGQDYQEGLSSIKKDTQESNPEDNQANNNGVLTFHLRPDHEADYEELLTTLQHTQQEIQGVVQLWPLDTSGMHSMDSTNDLEAPLHHICGTTLYLVQTLLRHYAVPPRLWLVTRDAQAVLPTDRITGIVQGSLWGMGRTIALEHPELDCVCLDLDNSTPLTDEATALCAELMTNNQGESRERQIALRQTTAYVARLAPYDRLDHQPEATSLTIKADGTYLLTGGLGGLGLQVAQWLAEQGAGHLLLVGRSQPTPTMQQQISEIESFGTGITVVQADISQPEQIAQALGQVPVAYPLRGVIHAAGILDDCALLHKAWADFYQVLAPKVAAWHLHTSIQQRGDDGDALDFFVLFSSRAGLFGNRGQADHAAANTLLDSLAHYRQAHDLPALSINWGAWSRIGAAAALMQQYKTQITASGEDVIDPVQGIQTFAYLLQQTAPQVGVMPILWKKFMATEQARSPFFANFAQYNMPSVAPKITTQLSFRQQFDRTAPLEQRHLLIQHIQQVVASVLRLDSPQKIDPHAELRQIGMDSLMGLELRRQLEASLQVSLRSTLIFEYPTIDLLTTYLMKQISEIPAEGVSFPQDDLPTETMPTHELDALPTEDLVRLLTQKLEEID